MKIVCDNCATKYSIADEKVRGKVFKIRCKKCSHIIVVRGNENGEPAQASGAEAAAADEAPPASADSVWHLVIDREQVGPLTPAEVRAKFAAGECDVETYTWREGFADWLRLGSVDEFKDLAAAAAAADEGATRRTDSADLFARAAADEAAAGQDAGSDLFGAGGKPEGAFGRKPAEEPAADVFAAPAAAASGFAAAASEAAAPAPSRSRAAAAAPVAAAGGGEAMESGAGVGGSKLSGQRNENSVLFSLNNLQALATNGSQQKSSPSGGGGGGGGGGASAPRPGFANSQTEGSGLIDIRAMAASTLSSGSSSSSSSNRADDLPSLSAAPIFAPMAAPIMMPASPQGMPKWIWAVFGIGGVLVVGMVVVTVLVFTRKPEPLPVPPVVATNTPPVNAVGTPPPGTPTTPTPPTAAGNPKAATPPVAAKADAPAADDRGGKKHRDRTGDKKASSTGTPERSNLPSGVVAPPETPKKSGGKKDSLDDLLDGASPDKPGKKPAAAAREPAGGGDDLPEQLGKGDIVKGMSGVKGNVANCYTQFKVPGMAMVSVTIKPSGSVASASVGGAFAGTPTGSCVEKAVKAASFSKFKGPAQQINYPYILR